jgi:hypothetical protein
MAKGSKKKTGKRGGKKRGKKAAKKKTLTIRVTKVTRADRKKWGKIRADMHRHAASLPDFYGGRPLVKGHSSGCGRPRKKK